MCCSSKSNQSQSQHSLAQKLLCCFQKKQSDFSQILNIKTLTCDKLSHCLFDFDCADLNVYERETYNYQEFFIDKFGIENDTQNNNSDALTNKNTTNDTIMFRDGIRVWFENFLESQSKIQQENLFMRFLYKPESFTLWGLHQVYLQDFQKDSVNKDSDIADILDELDEENEVEMNKTMWLVLRKTKPQNQTLKNFFSEPMPHNIKLKDIIKFGRVNFKISALSCSRLKPEVQGYNTSNFINDPMSAHSVSHIDKNMISQISMLNHTEMNIMDNYTMHTHPNNQSTFMHNLPQNSREQILKGGNTPIKTKEKKAEGKANGPSRQARVCRICLGEEEDDEMGEFVCPCNCSGSMADIHISCLKEWLNGKKLVYHGDRVKSFFWKALECELCKQPFENKLKDRLFQIMDFERPDSDYMIMESVKSAPAKVVHVFYLGPYSEFKIGRSVDTDMKIADISVSRLHSYIRIVEDRLIIEDNGSKFGTLIKIKEPYEVAQANNSKRQQSLFQIGRTLIYYGLIQKGKNIKKTRRNRKVDSSKLHENMEFVKTISGQSVPCEFIKPFKDQKKKKVDKRFQLSNEQQMISKMHTGRDVIANNNRPFENAESEESKQIINQIQDALYDMPLQSPKSNHQDFNQISNDGLSSQSQVNHNLHQSLVKRQINPHHLQDLHEQDDEGDLSEESMQMNQRQNTRLQTQLNHQKYKSIVPGVNFKINQSPQKKGHHQRYRSLQNDKQDISSNIYEDNFAEEAKHESQSFGGDFADNDNDNTVIQHIELQKEDFQHYQTDKINFEQAFKKDPWQQNFSSTQGQVLKGIKRDKLIRRESTQDRLISLESPDRQHNNLKTALKAGGNNLLLSQYERVRKSTNINEKDQDLSFNNDQLKQISKQYKTNINQPPNKLQPNQKNSDNNNMIKF